MEMNVTSFHQEMEEPENETIESVVLPFFSQTDKFFAPPQVLPHVGEQYQAVIPSLIIECKSKSLEAQTNLPNFVPEYSQISHRTEILELRVEHMDFQSQPMKCVGCGAKDIDSCLSEESRAKIDEMDKDLCLFHYSLSESWREMDCQIFVLGLYIFGKNFTLLQRFVQTKTMGDILSYYYGTFYSSDAYRRWSRGRKSSNRWCIKGQKMFTGWRQQELICRLSSRVSIEIQNRLLQLSQTYGEGKISFEDYVFTLTNLVGMEILVEAIGIGKGKKDLTRKSMESKKANRVIPVHTELLTGKACSLLTSSDIIKILTGDFRLSKTRCNDLFWEAVWPRLLARGWHSEQRNKHVLFGSREPLIFFLPGVGKFSKCELLKGSHYFDSVSDVLHKVASEPELLDSEINEQNENSVDPCVNLKIDDDMPLEKLKCYLQPRCRGDLDQLKFPVVDTSMVDGARFKFRGLRCLPAQTIRKPYFSSDSGETEGDTTKKSVQGQDGSISKPLENMTGNKVSFDDSDCTSTLLNATMLPTVVHMENQKAQSERWLKDRKAEKYQFGRKIDTGSLKNLASLTNEWDQNGNFHREQETSGAELVSSNETNFLSLFSDVIPEPGFCKNSKSSTPLTSLAIANRVENDVNISESFQGKDVSPENYQSMALIDLNLPHVDTDAATDELLMMQSELCENNLLFSPESKQSCTSSAELSNGVIGTENNQRPTRNRPLTTKALEAFEHEFFNEKGKRKNGTQHNNVKTKPFRQARAKNGKRETVKNGSGGQTLMVDFKVEEISIWPPVTPILAHTFSTFKM